MLFLPPLTEKPLLPWTLPTSRWKVRWRLLWRQRGAVWQYCKQSTAHLSQPSSYRNVLFHKEIAWPYRHQHISGHPSHILNAFGRQEVPSETYDKQGDEKQQTEDAPPNLTTFSFLKTRCTEYRLIPFRTFGTQPFSAIGTLGYRRFLGMIKTIHSVIN